MKALRISDYGAPLHIDEVPVPTPAPGQVLVENYYTSMNGVDPGRGQGFLRQVFQLQFPWTPGGDVGGRVAAIGEGVTNFKVGDEVFGYTREAGAYAEFVLVNAASLAHRPTSISAEVGAAIALVGQTATQMLSLSKVTAGQTLLILGASGGVGTLAIQLAKNCWCQSHRDCSGKQSFRPPGSGSRACHRHVKAALGRHPDRLTQCSTSSEETRWCRPTHS